MPLVPEAPKTEDVSEGAKQVTRAKQLEKERAALTAKIASNRTFLRLMDENDSLTAEQSAWLAEFYPLKEKGERRSDEEIEATRKAKLAARS